MSALDALRYALRGFARGGQRGVLALACIAFGVFSLVGLLLLGSMVKQSIQVPPRSEYGGDLLLTYGEDRLGAAQVAELARLKEEGALSAYTLFAATPLAMVRTEATGRVYFVGRAMGVDPSTYPLVGEVVMSEPAGVALAALLTEPGSTIITQNLARTLGVGVGERLRLGGGASAPLVLTVSGIATRIPDRRGDTMLFGLETARQVLGREAMASHAAAVVVPGRGAEERLRASGWNVLRAADKEPGNTEVMFVALLRGAGLLGLLIGGLGVANTLQVTLARRTPEIAALKTLGYRQRDLLLLFGIETALLGVIGSLLGAVSGTLLARLLMRILDSVQGALLLEFKVDLWVIAGGVAAGTMTAVIFGLYAIVRASAVRPSVLLRELTTAPTRQTRLAASGLVLLLVLLFGVLAALVMGSPLHGAVVVAVAAVGLALLGGAMAALLAVVLKLPAPPIPPLALALRNLRHRRMRSVFAMIALFAGVFSIGYASAALYSGKEKLSARRGSDAGENLVLHTAPAGEAAAVAAVRAGGAEPGSIVRLVSAKLRRAEGARLAFADVLEGRAADDSLGVRLLDGAAWSADPGAAYLPWVLTRMKDAPAVGERITVEIPGVAEPVALRVAGFYERSAMLPGSASAVLVNRAALEGARGGEVRISMAVAPAQLAAVAEGVGRRLPDAMLISKGDLNELRARSDQALFTFVAAVAGLALVAGAVLIANAVGLAMLERRREIGIFKALGYTRARVLGSVLLENALLGLLAGLGGMAAARGAVTLTNLRFERLGMELPATYAVALIALSVALALASAAVVAWRPTGARPLEVLRAE